MRVHQRDVPTLVERLRSEGVTWIRRHPPRLDGTVDVVWRKEGEPDDSRTTLVVILAGGALSLLSIVAWLVYEFGRTR